uniref:Uncharacterized protein n=1 Tax=Trypanosoma congolense (strain IL3000) TaxID=1068625 RepID=G0UXS1_TRYCI|nr:conserved hypothetical protein [Trypanosoma congolense IL3000]
MSLFDHDDDDVSSRASSTTSTDNTDTPFQREMSASLLPPAAACDVLRFTLSVEESQRAEERRRAEANKHLLQQAGGCRSDTACGGSEEGGGSRFGSSIAEALKVRRDIREKLLLQRLSKQRLEETNSAELVKKDMEVGVFITPQYLNTLARQRSAQNTSQDACKVGALRSDEAVDPLEWYVRDLEERRRVASQKAAPVSETVEGGDAAAKSDDGRIKVRVMQEASLVGSDTSLSSKAVSGDWGSPGGHISSGLDLDHAQGHRDALSLRLDYGDGSVSQPLPHVTVDSVDPEEMLRAVRKSRQERRAGWSFIESAATRLNLRSMDRINALRTS